MDLLRRSRVARWLATSLLACSLAVLPPLRMGCACAGCGTSNNGDVAACCSPSGDSTGCCCSTGGCGGSMGLQPSCCEGEIPEAISGCQCSAAPSDREPVQVPPQHSPANDLIAVATLHADWQLPPVIPVVADGCDASLFGLPFSGPPLQIVYCVWRN